MTRRTFYTVKPLPKKGEAYMTLDGGRQFDTLDEALAHGQAERSFALSQCILRVEVAEVARIEAEVAYTARLVEPMP